MSLVHLKPFREEHPGASCPAGVAAAAAATPSRHARSHKLSIGFGISGRGFFGFVRTCRSGFQIDVREVTL